MAISRQLDNPRNVGQNLIIAEAQNTIITFDITGNLVGRSQGELDRLNFLIGFVSTYQRRNTHN